MFSDPRPEDVFTPRASVVNPKTYVDRSELETRLKDALKGTKHLVIHGESGNGKSWLYKRVFDQQGTPHVIINLANAARFGSISNAIKDKIKRSNGNEAELAQIVSNHQGGIAPEGVGYTYSKQKIFDVVEKDPYEAILALVRNNAGRKKSCSCI